MWDYSQSLLRSDLRGHRRPLQPKNVLDIVKEQGKRNLVKYKNNAAIKNINFIQQIWILVACWLVLKLHGYLIKKDTLKPSKIDLLYMKNIKTRFVIDLNTVKKFSMKS